MNFTKKKKKNRKKALLQMFDRLEGMGSKYTLASGRYWEEKLIVEKKFKK